ncbi:MAG: rhomboid family intramembrane serine protease [Planctomycetota bacterium]
MFFPYADELSREHRVSWMNWLLIALNVWFFIDLGLRSDYEVIVLQYGFTPVEFRHSTLLTSIFLHGGWMHLLSNMWFLYLFGDNVESRCGPFKYLFAYLIAGIVGNFSQYAFFPDSAVPSIGASGAIFGVLGMYLFFFPGNRIKVFYFVFIFIGSTAVRAVWVIGLFFCMELFYSRLQTMSGVESGVGHLAHSGGLIAGVVLAAFYTALKLTPNDHRHLWAYLTGTAESDNARESEKAGAVATPATSHQPLATNYQPLATSDPRHEIVALLHTGRADEAKRAWRRYAFDQPEGVLPAREQLEVALALDKNGEHGVARDAYERLLAAYPNEQPFSAEANLALAGMLLQEIKETGDQHELPLIQKLLRYAAEQHPSPTRRKLALRWLQATGDS